MMFLHEHKEIILAHVTRILLVFRSGTWWPVFIVVGKHTWKYTWAKLAMKLVGPQ